MKIKSAYIANWVTVDPKIIWRSRRIHCRDGIIAGLVVGFLVGACSDWPKHYGAAETATRYANISAQQQNNVNIRSRISNSV